MTHLDKMQLQLENENNPTPELKGYVAALNNVRKKISERREMLNKAQERKNVKAGIANTFELF